MKKTIALCLLFIISLFVITGCEGDSGLPSSKKSISLDFNKTIDYKGNYEVSFEKFESGKNIKKIYLESDDLNDKNNQYFVVWGKIKNIGTEKMDWWNMIPSTLIYDGKYKYEMTCKAVSQNDIQPLSSDSLACYVEVPSEVVTDTSKTLVMSMEIDGNNYELNVR